MKIAIAQQSYHINDLEENAQKIIEQIEEAKKKHIDLLVFSELCLTGYPPEDVFFSEDFFLKTQRYFQQIVLTTKGIGVIIGMPRRAHNTKIYNSGIFLYDKKILGIADKTLLPEYDVFNERRFFNPGIKHDIIKFKNKRIALTICEDIWFDDKKYDSSPLDKLQKKGKLDVVINLSASPFDYEHLEERKKIIKKTAVMYHAPIIYCNSVGVHTDLVFDGNSLVANNRGDIIFQGKAFEEDLIIFEYADLLQKKGLKTKSFKLLKGFEKLENSIYAERIYGALIYSIKEYFKKSGFTHAIIGASGGIDSAVVQTLAVRALGRDKVSVVMMPSMFSSQHSIDDAVQLSKNLQNEYHILPINDIYQNYLKTLYPIFKNTPFSVAEENLQSRVRGCLLMAIANKENRVLLNTSNKSELAMGYGTLYGDMAGGISVLGDLFKTQVYALAKYINKEGIIIPEHILSKAPSAELKPNQKDSDSLPEYPVLDKMLYAIIHEQKNVQNIAQRYKIAIDLVKKTHTTYWLNEYKRYQFCPIIRVSNKAFGRGRRVEVVAKR